MANPDHLKILKRGVKVWNAWRTKHHQEAIDLRRANLEGQFIGSRFEVFGVDLSGEVDFSKADLSNAILRRADLREADLSSAILRGADLQEADLRGTDLSGVDLSGADLSRKDLRKQDLRGANLSGANLSETNLIEANLNGATLTDACLWETQRAGWSIQGIICEAVYWDRDRQERTLYSLGEFERLYADKIKVVLQYAGGIISPVEIATLPSMIEIMQKWSNCVLRLDSLQDAPGGATVTLVIEDPGKRNADQTVTLQAELKNLGQRTIEMQRELLQEREGRLRAEGALNFVHNFFSPLMERAMGKSQEINVKGNVYGPIGQVSGGKYTFNDLVAIKDLIDEIFEHRAELSLTSEKLAILEASIQTVQDQCAAYTPNHSMIREAVRSVRNIIEGAIGSTIASGWLLLLQRLG